MPARTREVAAQAGGVTSHYSRDDLVGLIMRALASSGRAPADVQVEDLAPFDQFHLRGLAATLDLIALARIGHGERVLDLGGGLGGSARVAASRTGCHVTVVDLTPVLCESGEELTRRLNLEEHVHFLVGDATAPPVPDASFDVVWTQHASMNIPDKSALYHAAARALVPGGRFAFHDVMGDDGMDGLHYPVPWAAHAEQNALMHHEQQRVLVRGAGFTERAWHDVTDGTRDWLAERLQAPDDSPQGLQMATGLRSRPASENLLRNLAEGRLRVVEALFD